MRRFTYFISHGLGQGMLSLKSKILSGIDRYCPRICCLCHKPLALQTHSGLSATLCAACIADLPSVPECCLQCATHVRLPYSLTTTNPSHLRCGQCQCNPPPFDRTFALFPYTFPISSLIIHLKFSGNLVYARTLADLMLTRIQTTWYRDRPLPDYLIPVPLHPRRLAERGFNQALEIARPLAAKLPIRLARNLLIRHKATAPQHLLPKALRASNVTNAFMITKPLPGSTVALLDDVMTTGQTLSACATALRQAGATQIDIWCCARR